jgi:hypothetical protein
VAKPREIWHGHYHICYDRKVDLGYGPVLVHGLSMDATDLALNMAVIELELPVNREPLSTPDDVVLGEPGADSSVSPDHLG